MMLIVFPKVPLVIQQLPGKSSELVSMSRCVPHVFFASSRET